VSHPESLASNSWQCCQGLAIVIICSTYSQNKLSWLQSICAGNVHKTSTNVDRTRSICTKAAGPLNLPFTAVLWVLKWK